MREKPSPSVNVHVMLTQAWINTLPDNSMCLADNGFWDPSVFPPHLKTIMPVRAGTAATATRPARGRFDMTEDEIRGSHVTSAWRSVVERAHARIKRFRVCQYVTPGSVTLENLEVKWRVAAILSNMYFTPLAK